VIFTREVKSHFHINLIKQLFRVDSRKKAGKDIIFIFTQFYLKIHAYKRSWKKLLRKPIFGPV